MLESPKDTARRRLIERLEINEMNNKKILKAIFNDILDKSEESYMTDEDGNHTTGRLIKNKDLEEIRMKYMGE